MKKVKEIVNTIVKHSTKKNFKNMIGGNNPCLNSINMSKKFRLSENVVWEDLQDVKILRNNNGDEAKGVCRLYRSFKKGEFNTTVEEGEMLYDHSGELTTEQIALIDIIAKAKYALLKTLPYQENLKDKEI